MGWPLGGEELESNGQSHQGGPNGESNPESLTVLHADYLCSLPCLFVPPKV